MNKKQAIENLIEHRDLIYTNALFNSNAGNALKKALDVAIKELEEID